MDKNEIVSFALENGFSAAAITGTDTLVVDPGYRKYCEENLCGCYDRLSVCPPQSGTVEEMRERFIRYPNALVLQTLVTPDDKELFEDPRRAKSAHNRLAEKLIALLPSDHLWMSAGPYQNNSCMSAYCVDCQKLADSVGMLCWAHDGNYRFFSVICF